MRWAIAWTMFLLVAADGRGQTSVPAATNLKPWQWSVEQRLAARFDDTARNQRIAAYQQTRGGRLAATSALSNPAPTDVIHGSEHPELLLPFEIFNTFVRAAFGEDDDTAAEVKRDASSKAVALGLPGDFLTIFERETRTFITAQREEIQLRQLIATGKIDGQRGMARVRALAIPECRSRADAIRNLRRMFGSRFDEFLYSAIAPGVSRDFFEPVSAQKLRIEEEGCR